MSSLVQERQNSSSGVRKHNNILESSIIPYYRPGSDQTNEEQEKDRSPLLARSWRAAEEPRAREEDAIIR